jgi:hypothetical protein
LIQFDQHGVGALFLDFACDKLRVRDKNIVADDLDACALRRRLSRESSPVVFVEAVLDRDDWKASIHL